MNVPVGVSPEALATTVATLRTFNDALAAQIRVLAAEGDTTACDFKHYDRRELESVMALLTGER